MTAQTLPIAFAPPPLAQILDDIAGDIETSIAGADGRLPRSALAGIGYAKGGVANEEYYAIRWVYKQLFPQSSDWQALLWQGQLKNVYPKLASAAVFAIAASGNNDVTAAAGTILNRSDGAQFTLDDDMTIADSAGAVNVTATVPGSAGNTPIGTSLSFAAPIAAIRSAVTVGALVQTGFDAETIDAFRGRVIEAWQNPPQGGDLNDYAQWAKEIAGVTRAWPFKNWMGVGTIGVCFVEDNNPAGIIPSGGDIAAVQTYLDTVRKVTADVTVFAPTALNLNPTIHISPDNAANRAAVTANLNALIGAEALPGGSTSANALFYLSHIEEAVDTAAGIVDNVISLLVGVAPANIVIAPGQLLQLGDITWV